MIKLKLALQFIYKDLWHYFLVLAILLCIILLCIINTIAYINIDGYLSLSKDLTERDYYYLTIDYDSIKEVKLTLQEMDDEVKVYGLTQYAYRNSEGFVSVIAISENLQNNLYYKTKNGIKKYSFQKGGLATVDSGLKIGDVVKMELDEKKLT